MLFIWGLGIGDWGLGIGDWAQSPIPNPQFPIPNPQSPFLPFVSNIFFITNLLSKYKQLMQFNMDIKTLIDHLKVKVEFSQNDFLRERSLSCKEQIKILLAPKL